MEKKHVVAATAILLLLAGVGWALFSCDDAEMVEMKKQRDELMQKIDTLTPEQRRAEFEALRDRAENLSEEQRRELRRGGQQFMMQRVDRLLAMSRDDQVKELDQWIDRMEQRRQQRSANGGQGRGNQGRDTRGDRGGNMSPAQQDQRRKERLDRSTPEMRAKMDAFKDLINDRREERGMEPIQGGRPGGFFGRPGGPR